MVVGLGFVLVCLCDLNKHPCRPIVFGMDTKELLMLFRIAKGVRASEVVILGFNDRLFYG